MAEGYATGGIGVGVPIVPLEKLIQQELDAENSLLTEGATKKIDYDGLTSYVLQQFQINKDAKISSGIEEEILDSVRVINGKYTDQELGKIASEGGSDIFMNITATKSRTAKSWLSDIFIPAKGKAWSLEPSPLVELPEETKRTIEEAVNKEFQELVNGSVQQNGTTVEQSEQVISETNQLKRDVSLSMEEEINKEARFQLQAMEKKIEDQLNQGKFNQALLTFLEDLCIYPAAFMKGPVICKKPRIYWNNGKAEVQNTYYFMNERVDPLDIYPSPDATCIQDGNLIEHLRLSPATIANLKGIVGYSVENIDKVLTEKLYGNSWLDTGAVESQKVTEEQRGDEVEANKDVVHGLHYFGTVPYGKILEWNPSFKVKGEEKLEEQDLVEVEIILAGTQVIKCNVNGDPLKRRPYYKASYMNRPGSFWGRSLPSMMSDIQRVCNAAARAIANNMAIGSGPMVEVYVDRLADSGSITEMKPRQIWQTVPDPTGAGGRAIQFFQPSLVAGELLTIYKEFEQKADDVTGIPAYAYGNERNATAPTTVGGLSMLLESASKIIKDCVRNIDEGLIKPRIEYQFYFNILYNRINYTGDVEVVPRASSVLTTKSAEALRRQEFLMVTANQFDQEAMGMEGRTEILRTMAEDLGLPGSAIPNRLDIKRKQRAIEANASTQMQMDQQNKEADRQASIAATQVQIDGQERMHQGTLAATKDKNDKQFALEKEALDIKAQDALLKHRLKGEEIQSTTDTANKATQVKEENNLREIGLKLSGKTGI